MNTSISIMSGLAPSKEGAKATQILHSPMDEVTHIRSLRKVLIAESRELQLPLSVTKALEVVNGYMKSGTDAHGWRKVDWKPRGNGSSNQHKCVPAAFDRRPIGPTGNIAAAQAAAAAALGTTVPAAGGAGRSSESSSKSAVRSATIHTGPPVRYVSKFKTAAPEKVDDTILNTIILGKLNKFSTGNYDDIKDFLCQILDSGQTDFLKHFMLLVFQKAAAEEFFCPLYAKLLSELSSKYTILLSEMATLYGEYIQIFEEIDESSAADYNDFVKRTEQKKYRLGYSQFLAELIKHGTVNTDFFMKTVQTICKQLTHAAKKEDSTRIVEEYADCLSRIMKAIQTSTATESIKSIRKEICADAAILEPFTKKDPANKSLSNKARFAMMDIYEAVSKF